MNIRNLKEIRSTARQSLASNTGNARAAVLIYTCTSCLLSLAATIVSWLLSNQIAETGGLSNMGLRSILSTIQYILPFVQVLVMMSLALGYSALTLDIARNRPARPATLLEGFYKFFPLLRSVLLQGVIYLLVSIACMYVSSWLFMMLPVSNAFNELMAPYLASATVLNPEIVLDETSLAAAAAAMAPMVWIFFLVFCIVALPIFYQYRMVSYCLADSDRPGALAALRESKTMLRGNRFSLFKLDLSFWWYYLLEVLIALVCYGDMLLPLLGVSFPWSDTVSFFLFFVLSLVLQLGVYYCFMNRVQVTYATVYEAIRPKPQEHGAVLGNIFEM